MAVLMVGLIADPDAVTELAEDLVPDLGERLAADDPERRSRSSWSANRSPSAARGRTGSWSVWSGVRPSAAGRQ
jgi:hypothetical protein